MKKALSLFLCFLFLTLAACSSGAHEPASSATDGAARLETDTVGTKTTAGTPDALTTAGTAKTETPTTQTPSTQTPSTQTPSTQTPTTETPSTQTPTVETPTELTEEERRDLDDRAFLATIPYPTYEPADEGQAFFLGRWIKKEIDGAPHHVTVTDGAQLFLLTRDCLTVTFDFTVITKLETPYFAVSIDGKEPVRQLITEKTVTLPDSGRHVLRVVADGMTESEAKWNDEIGFALKEIVPGQGGSMRAVKPKNKVVFFYGDSITEGVKTLVVNNKSEGNSASGAYPWYTCENLGAIPYYIGYGASGVNCTGSFSTFYNAILKLSRTRDVDFSVKPDLIVVNHGTNDGNWDKQDKNFSKNLKRALKALQKNYPGVPILVMIPFCQAHIADINEVCDALEGVSVLETKSVGMTTSDGLHPTKAASITGGKKIAKLITDLLGEDFFAIG